MKKKIKDLTFLTLEECTLDPGLRIKNSNMIDLYLFELTNGEELLCTGYCSTPTEYSLDMISPEICTYDILKEEVKSIKVFKTCMLTSICEEN